VAPVAASDLAGAEELVLELGQGEVRVPAQVLVPELAPVEARAPEPVAVLELARVEVRAPVLQRWARRTKPVRRVKRTS
jgi:hypothetical protein